MDQGMGLLGFLVTGFLTVMVLLFIIGFIFYVLTALGISGIAKNTMYKRMKGLGWVPVVNLWFLGVLVGDINLGNLYFNGFWLLIVQLVLSSIGMTMGGLAFIVLNIIGLCLLVLYYLTLYKKFTKINRPGLMTGLTIIFPFIFPIILFSNRHRVFGNKTSNERYKEEYDHEYDENDGYAYEDDDQDYEDDDQDYEDDDFYEYEDEEDDY